MRGLDAMSAPKCAGAAMSRALLVSNSRLACAECGLRHTAPRETLEEPERPLPNHVVDFCSPLFLKGCVTVDSENVVDADNSQTFSEEGKFRLRVLTQLHSFVHGVDDIGRGRELVRCVLSWSDSDSERGASIRNCEDFGHVLHVANPPLKRRSDFGAGDVELLQVRRQPDRVTLNVTVVHAPQVRQASVLL